jgi:S1-C subfamily serine protease
MRRSSKPSDKPWLFLGVVLFFAFVLLNVPRIAFADDDEHGFLGVYLADKAEIHIGKEGDTSAGAGAYIQGVVEDGPADEAGIKRGDVIVRFNGDAVEDSDDLRRLIGKTRPGDEVEVVVLRNGDEKTLTVKMGEQDETEEYWSLWKKYLPFMAPYGNRKRIRVVCDDRPWMGIEMQRLTDQLRDYFKVKDGGVLISSVAEDSPAEKAGLQAGDVIVKIDGEEIENRRDIIEILEDKEVGDEITVSIIRDGKSKKKKVTLAENPQKDKVRCWTFGDNDEDIEIYCPEDLRELPPLPEFNREFLKDLDVDVKVDVEDLKEELEQLKEELEVLKEKVEKKK